MNHSLSKKLWLTFAQSVTVCLGLAFVLRMFFPDLLVTLFDASALKKNEVVVQQVEPQPHATTAGSYRDAVQKAAPAVVNIFTSKKVAANP